MPELWRLKKARWSPSSHPAFTCLALPSRKGGLEFKVIATLKHLLRIQHAYNTHTTNVAAIFPQLEPNCTQVNGICPRIPRLLLPPVETAASLNSNREERLKIKGIYYNSASLVG
jgi:hypothetical protein